MKKLTGKRALVTGASSGFGKHFAQRLAALGANLILVARNGSALASLAEDLKSEHRVDVVVMTCDLSDETSVDALHREILKRELQIDIFIANAGVGMHGPFLNQDAGKVRKMLHLNITGLTHLTHEIALGMVSRRDGHILLVASILGYQAVPDFASYAASKAYVLHFGEALHNELKPHGVNVTVLSPGFSLTSFAKNAEQKVTPVLGMMAMAPETVVDIGMKAMLKGRAGVIAGLPNVLAAFSNRFAPRSLQRWIMRRIVSG